MQLDIINLKGEKTGRTVELPEEIFGIEPNDHVIYLAVKQYQGAQRQGTHKVKTRMEVKGSSKKLHKQKGTGGARKARWARTGSGKSGGFRVIYTWFADVLVIVMLDGYPKNEKENLSDAEKREIKKNDRKRNDRLSRS